METTTDQGRRRLPRADDFTRTGAVWVTGTGAFLLVVAATVFVAVRWDQLPEAMKLAVLGAMSGSALLAGRRLRERLPATGAVLYHLGAFLLPVVAAAVLIRFDPTWSQMLLVEGITGAAVFTALERVERSVVLRTATALAVVVATLGLGAAAGVAPAASLAVVALFAECTSRRTLATFWALLAGLTPAIALVAPWFQSATVLDDLALTNPGAHRVALVSALAAAGVLFIEARRRSDLVLLVAAAASVALGGAATLVSLRPPNEAMWLGAALLFGGIEIAAWYLDRDAFLRAPSRFAAIVAEVTAAGATIPLAIGVLVAPLAVLDVVGPHIDGGLVAATIITVAAWLTADVRRRVDDHTPPTIALLVGSGWVPATFAIAATAIGGAAVSTGSGVVTAITMTATAAVLVVSGRSFGHGLAAWLTIGAVVTAVDAPGIAWGCAVVGMVVLCGGAVVRARRIRPTDPDIATVLAWGLAAASFVPVGLASVIAIDWANDMAILVGWVGACWLAALTLDQAARNPQTPHVGLLGRAAMLAIIPAALVVGPAQAAIIAAAIAILTVIDALRRRDEADAFVASAAIPIAVATAGSAFEAALGSTAIVLSATALFGTMACLVTPRRWQPPMIAGTAWATFLGVAMSTNDDRAFATVLLFTGGSALTIAVARRSIAAAVAGAALVCLGVWIHLDVAGIEATDAYVAPVAASLLVAGLLARHRNGLSSWIAYGPAIGLLGMAALAERLAGGAGIHALVAGTVGTVAVAVGGWRRLAAPLLLGTVLLVAVVVSETMAYTATMPTWGWLALSGSALVAAGIAMERAEVGPIETGRRVVDVLHDRFV